MLCVIIITLSRSDGVAVLRSGSGRRCHNTYWRLKICPRGGVWPFAGFRLTCRLRVSDPVITFAAGSRARLFYSGDELFRLICQRDVVFHVWPMCLTFHADFTFRTFVRVGSCSSHGSCANRLEICTVLACAGSFESHIGLFERVDSY